MSDLKLIALDAEDLNVMSAHLQDAALRVADMAYLPREKRFAMVLNRFDWAEALQASLAGGARKFERRRAGLRFERVVDAKVLGIDLGDKTAALALLAIVFEPAGGPEAVAGNVTLTFSGGAAIRLQVEYLEAEMKDLGAVWVARNTPQHGPE
ncbi:MAG: DUF2948 family protein [Hyphomicrobium sp.]